MIVEYLIFLQVCVQSSWFGGIHAPTNCLSVHLFTQIVWLTLYIMKMQRNYCQSITNAHICYWHFYVSFPGLCFCSAGKLFYLVCQPHWAVLVSHGWLFKLQEQVLFFVKAKKYSYDTLYIQEEKTICYFWNLTVLSGSIDFPHLFNQQLASEF